MKRSVASLGWHRLYNCEVVFADLSQENFAGDETNKQFLEWVCGEAWERAQSSGSACVGPIATAMLLAPIHLNGTWASFTGEQGKRRHLRVAAFLVGFLMSWNFMKVGRMIFLVQPPMCLSKTRRLAGDHGKCLSLCR